MLGPRNKRKSHKAKIPNTIRTEKWSARKQTLQSGTLK